MMRSDAFQSPVQTGYCTETPAGWKVLKLKRLISVSSGDFLAPEAETESGFPVYGGNGIRGYAATSNCRGKTLLIGRVGAQCGNVHLVDGEFWYSEHALRVFPIQPCSLNYFKYLIGVIDLNQFANRTAQPLINSRTTTDRYAAIPPLPEQERIAAYLDASCAAIDAAVAAKRRQLETLDALRKTVIQEAVTKGLNPNVEMINSGIDWLPEIPKDWNKTKLKRHAQIIRGQFTHRPRNDPAFYDGPYPFIQTGSISVADKFITEFTQTLNEDGLRISKLFPKDTVVMTITGAKIAEVAVTAFEACFPDSIVGFIPDHRLNRDYLLYLLIAMKPALLRAMVVTTQPNINYVQIGGNYIPLPPVREQESIAQHIEEKTQRFREIRTSLDQQICTLNTYRKSLIHECVTGQRRISEADLNRANAHG